VLIFTQITHRLWRGLLATILTSLIVLAVGLMTLHFHGERLLSVETASMVPTFRPGDALIVAPALPKALHIGDVISYISLRDPRVIISHRLIRIDATNGQLVTAGDSLHTDDPPFSTTAVIGRVTAIMPHFGEILNTLRKPSVMVFVVCMPAVIFLYTEFLRLVHFFKRPMYRIHGYQPPSSDRLKL